MENGAVAGLIVSFITNPAELIKVIMQSTGEQRFKNSKDCMKHIIKTEGLRGLMRGNVTMIAREVPGYAAQFAIYEYLKNIFISK